MIQMKALVLYDSQFGNTEKVAQGIVQGIASHAEVQSHRLHEISPDQVEAYDLIVVGSPTQRFNATEAMKEFLTAIPAKRLRGKKVASFDTRFTEEHMRNTPVLKYFVWMAGYAAKPIAQALKKAGGELVAPPEGFYVADTEGPLLEGELERAEAWGSMISEA
jgi:flavodoxin